MKNKKANHTGKIIIGLIILGLILVIWLNSSVETSSIERDELKVEDEIETKEEIKVDKNTLLPNADENYSTCGELVPENMTLRMDYYGLRSADGLYGLLFGSKSLLKNNQKIFSYGMGKSIYTKVTYNAGILSHCRYNSEVGEKATDFRCKGKYYEKSPKERVSDEGIIQEQEDYKISFDMLFSDEKCSIVDGTWYVNCEVIDYSCKVEKCVMNNFGHCK